MPERNKLKNSLKKIPSSWNFLTHFKKLYFSMPQTGKFHKKWNGILSVFRKKISPSKNIRNLYQPLYHISIKFCQTIRSFASIWNKIKQLISKVLLLDDCSGKASTDWVRSYCFKLQKFFYDFTKPVDI